MQIPIDILINEHKLIVRMIALMSAHLAEIKKGKDPDSNFIDKYLDFFISFGDKTHHGKEEDILFRELGTKPLSDQHRETMSKLLEEHVQAREMIHELLELNEKYKKGEENSKKSVIDHLDIIDKFYLKHIDTEDHHFFLEVVQYFNEKEAENMLNEFKSFDKDLITEKYTSMVEQLEQSTS